LLPTNNLRITTGVSEAVTESSYRDVYRIAFERENGRSDGASLSENVSGWRESSVKQQW
jgi:hypothetical protein